MTWSPTLTFSIFLKVPSDIRTSVPSTKQQPQPQLQLQLHCDWQLWQVWQLWQPVVHWLVVWHA
jgi:hypothetical protein